MQSEGRVKAFVTFKTTPNWELLLKASHRQDGAVFKTVFKPEQQEPSGLAKVLSFVTNDKQSAMLRIMVEQSTEGDGVIAFCDDGEAPLTAKMAKMQRMNENFEAMREKNENDEWGMS